MRKTTFSIFILMLLLLAFTASAQIGMMGNWTGEAVPATAELWLDPKVKPIIDDIYVSQNIDNSSDLDCGQVTDSQFEELGDVYMGLMLQNESQHEFMDNMMGGEGSSSLGQAHINMGRSFLGCQSGGVSGYTNRPMVGYGMMGNYGFGWNMMNGYNGAGSFLGFINNVLVLALLILAILGLIKYLKTDR